MLVINIKDNALIAWSVVNVLTWASAYYQNLKRIAKSIPLVATTVAA
jgi:hypothetical protein